MSKIISMLCDEKSPGTNGLNLEVIKRRYRRLDEVLYTIIKDAWKNLEFPAD